MKEPLRILIIDDHPLFREGLKAIVKRDPSYVVVGEAGDGAEGLRAARNARPDVAVVDIALPDMSGVDLVRRIKSDVPSTRILVLSMHSRIDYIAGAFQAGAAGYMVKESTSEGFLRAIEIIMKDRYFLDGSVSHEVVRRLMEAPESTPRIVDDRYDSLTPREQEILRLLAEGLTAKEIGARLHISPKTAENHRSRIMGKLGVHSMIELLRYAARIGLVDVDMWKQGP
ncbi:response regulator transcription factor [Candidatus Sumerlaeota bacterium]|nr:response regulator transcription factor [Candidatus Sumerlaeota bacterium]